MQILNVSFDGRIIELSKDCDEIEKNIFTVIVGKNGSGKSRLFQLLCNLYIENNSNFNFHQSTNIFEGTVKFRLADSVCILENSRDQRHHHRSIFMSEDPERKCDIVITQLDDGTIEAIHNMVGMRDDFINETVKRCIEEFKKRPATLKKYRNGVVVRETYTPNKLIAVTSSPFDKFPLNDDHVRSTSDSYVYRGAKTGRFNRNENFIDFKFSQLGYSFVSMFLNISNEKETLIKLFDFMELNYKFTLEFTSSSMVFTSYIRKIDNTESFKNISDEEIRSMINKGVHFSGLDRDSVTDKLSSTEFLNEVRDAISTVFGSQEKNTYSNFEGLKSYTKLNLKNEYKNKYENENLNELTLLASLGIVSLTNIVFSKKKTNAPFELKDASSGELCLLFNFMSVAAEIMDESLILIDEPELSLHPEWQDMFIPLLVDAFSTYKGCHFILATHSAQVTSSIPGSNSFVTNVENTESKCFSGSEVSNRSSDFLMARVFSFNRANNEYLIRIALNIFTSVSKNKSFPKELLDEYKLLTNISDEIASDSTLSQLITVLKEMHEIYG
jgi:predicted ATPase